MSGLGAGSSDVDIVSQALVLIGEAPISSLTEGTSGQVASSLYETTRDDMLASHRWRFASGKVLLNRLTATPLNEWTYGFQLPSNLVLLFRVYPFTPYEVFEDKLYSNQSSIEIDYIFNQGEGDFPAYFVKALSYKLAAEFALSITNNRTLSDVYDQKAARALASAKGRDAQGRPPQAIEHRPFINIRG